MHLKFLTFSNTRSYFTFLFYNYIDNYIRNYKINNHFRQQNVKIISQKSITEELSFLFICQPNSISRLYECLELKRLTGEGTSRFNINENNQKTTSRVASASANKLYHRILDTSIPRTCSEFASLRDATPHERHICRGLFGRTLLADP